MVIIIDFNNLTVTVSSLKYFQICRSSLPVIFSLKMDQKISNTINLYP